MTHCNINNAESVRRTISEIRRNDHYKPFIVTHNQQEFGVDYGHSRDHGDNGYEVLITKDIEVETGDIEKIEDENLNILHFAREHLVKKNERNITPKGAKTF